MFSVVRLAEKFAAEVDQESLKEEFEDLQLMEDDVITMEMDGQPRRLDAIWGDVLNEKTATGDVRFATLGKVMVPILSLPHSNADCERTFSMVRKIHTEARKSLHGDTITAFLRCKINYDCPCYDFAVTPSILRGAKTCTQEYNMEHPTRDQ